MSNCEQFEVLVSSWLDDALDRAEQVELMDHVVRCAACREFYMQSRSLDGLITVARTHADREVPSSELWRRIEERAKLSRKPRFLRAIPAWAMRAAAVMILAVGLSVALVNLQVASEQTPVDSEIRLGENAGQMTDARFVSLTREVLGSSPRYRTALFQIMNQVVRDAGSPENSSEALTRSTDDVERPESEISSRNPA